MIEKSFSASHRSKTDTSVRAQVFPTWFGRGGFVLSALFLAMFFVLAVEVSSSGLLNSLDLCVFSWCQRIRFAAADYVFLAITRLGNPATLTFVAIFTTLRFIVRRRYFDATLFAVGCSIAELCSFSAKWLIGRLRPLPASALVSVDSPAFPSGHVAVGGVAYIFLAYLIACELKSRVQRAVVVGFGLFVTLGVAWTRLYLGVHWLTDVMGGFALAGFWLVPLISLSHAHRTCG